MEKFKKGDRVKVLAQNAHPATGQSEYGYGRGIGMKGYVDEVNSDYYIVYVGPKDGKETYYAGFFADNELELVTTRGGDMEQPKQRRTFRLVKAMPGYKAGTLFQEQCEDGTQPYSVLSTPGMDHTRRDGVRLEFLDRSHVEDNPKWFEEVFLVSPQYQTREELDQWEAFKSRKKPGRKAKGLTVKEVLTMDALAASKPRKRRISAKQRARRSAAMKASWARRKAQKVPDATVNPFE